MSNQNIEVTKRGYAAFNATPKDQPAHESRYASDHLGYRMQQLVTSAKMDCQSCSRGHRRPTTSSCANPSSPTSTCAPPDR